MDLILKRFLWVRSELQDIVNIENVFYIRYFTYPIIEYVESRLFTDVSGNYKQMFYTHIFLIMTKSGLIWLIYKVYKGQGNNRLKISQSNL